MTDANSRQPLVLIASGDEWMGRSFESVFEKQGYLVARVESGARALKLARRASPDVVLLDGGLVNFDAVEVCCALRDDPLFDHSTPIVVTAPAHLMATTRNAAYRAGAWEFCTQPPDMDLLMLKLGTFLRARQEAAEAQSRCLIDATTGLYTRFGLRQLAEQLGAVAQRRSEAFACVALSHRSEAEVPSPGALGRNSDGFFSQMADVFRSTSRKSDVFGHVSETRLAVLAPATDAKGARLLVARLQDALDQSARRENFTGEFKLQAGFCAVTDLRAAHLGPADLVQRAQRALDHVQRDSRDVVLMSFDDLPIH